MTNTALQQMSDDALAAETKRVAGAERRSTAELISLLIEVERRGLHLSLGHSSLFTYCMRALHLSEQAAYSRITAARAARRFPLIIELLADGALTLSSVGLLAPHLTEETVEPLLDAARCKSTREVERLIAALHPQPDIRATVRAFPKQTPVLPLTTVATAAVNEPPVPSPPRAAPRQIVAPIAPSRYLLRLTVGDETHNKLQRLKALMRHSVPDGDVAVIVDRALTLLLHEVERTKYASTEKPRSFATNGVSGRHVPAAVKRAVWTRDLGRCVFAGPDGRCGEAGCLEFHHVIPFAAGGETTVDNLQLRCRAHNAHEATLFFGADPAP